MSRPGLESRIVCCMLGRRAVVLSEDDFQTLAWRDFILFAWDSPEMRAAFEKSTKLKLLNPPVSPLEAMIDKATGASEDVASVYVQSFIAWVTVWHWGLEEAPAAYREELKKGLPFRMPNP